MANVFNNARGGTICDGCRVMLTEGHGPGARVLKNHRIRHGQTARHFCDGACILKALLDPDERGMHRKLVIELTREAERLEQIKRLETYLERPDAPAFENTVRMIIQDIEKQLTTKAKLVQVLVKGAPGGAPSSSFGNKIDEGDHYAC